MNKTLIISVLIFGFITNINFAQQKKSFRNKNTYFVIQVKDVVTQKFADSIIFRNKDKTAKWEGSNSDFLPPPPPPPPMKVYFEKRNIHFIIKPKQYVQYVTPNLCDTDTKYNAGVSNILRIDRVSLMASKFSPFAFKLTENYRDFSKPYITDYKIIEIKKNESKIICGYSCYKVVLKDLKRKNSITEMYVTDEISLNYNPIFFDHTLLKKFYPLYLKQYNIDFPNEKYKEYTFTTIR